MPVRNKIVLAKIRPRQRWPVKRDTPELTEWEPVDVRLGTLEKLKEAKQITKKQLKKVLEKEEKKKPGPKHRLRDPHLFVQAGGGLHSVDYLEIIDFHKAVVRIHWPVFYKPPMAHVDQEELGNEAREEMEVDEMEMEAEVGEERGAEMEIDGNLVFEAPGNHVVQPEMARDDPLPSREDLVKQVSELKSINQDLKKRLAETEPATKMAGNITASLLEKTIQLEDLKKKEKSQKLAFDEKLRTVRDELAKEREEKQSLASECDALKARVEQLTTENDTLTARVATLQTECIEYQTKYDQAKGELDEKEAAPSLVEFQAKVMELVNMVNEKEEAEALVVQMRAQLKEQEKNARIDLNGLHYMNGQLQEENDSHKKEILELKKSRSYIL